MDKQIFPPFERPQSSSSYCDAMVGFSYSALLGLAGSVAASNSTYLSKTATSLQTLFGLAPQYGHVEAVSFSNASVVSVPTLRSGELAPIEVVGNKFFDSVTGEQFFLKGIAYQPSRATNDVIASLYDGSTIIDPMADPRLCMRDLPYLKGLGVNTVRVYSVDTDKDHDACFKAYREAGIYVLADMSEPSFSVDRTNPIWDTNLLNRYKNVVDRLSKYDNVLGFFAGNEVTNDRTNTDASPFVKSSIRDIKNYIKSKNYRQIPVGYSTNDDAETRDALAHYFACGEVSADFYGINMYEWCGFSSFHTSGYRERTEEFKNYPIPVFFSEFGCNLQRPRPFTEVEALFGRLMTGVWSGGLAYMYFEEPNQYGVVEISPNGDVSPLPDYYNLQKAYAGARPKGVTLEEYKATTQLTLWPKCPGESAAWKASTVLPQAPDQVKCDCMESTLKCKVAGGAKDIDLSRAFMFACNKVDCSEVHTDGIKGVYGAFSDCTAQQKASYALNEVFKKEGTEDEDCDFHGLAQLVNAVATDNELHSRVNQNGETCAEVLGEELLSGLLNSADPLAGHNSKTQNTSDESHRGSSPLDNRASSQKFYFNLSIDVAWAFIFVTMVTFMA